MRHRLPALTRPIGLLLGPLAVVALVLAPQPAGARTVPEPTAQSQGADSAPEGRHCTGLPTGRSTITLTSGGLTRSAVVYVPRRTLGGRGGIPLVLTLHGSFSTPVEQLDRSGLEATADRYGFVVAAPQGGTPAGPGFSWSVPYVTTGGPDDQRYLLDLVNRLRTLACTDSSRVSATGYSGGGRMISALACDHPGRLAAIMPVAGLRAGAPLTQDDATVVPDPATCSPRRAVPVLTFAGTADPVNPFAGGGAPYWGYGTVEAAQRWADLNRCATKAPTVQVSEHVTVEAWRDCRRGARVELYVVANGGHTWPGSPRPDLFIGAGELTQEVSANEVFWRFARSRVAPFGGDCPTSPSSPSPRSPTPCW